MTGEGIKGSEMNKTVTWRTMHNMHAPKIKIRDYFSRYFTQGC